MPKNFPEIRKTLGDHVLAKYLRSGLSHGEAAEQLGISRHVLWGWTSNRKTVSLKMIPRVIEWLGYDPLPETTSFGTRLRQQRIAAGLSQVELGKLLGIRANSIGEIKRGHPPSWE